MEKEQRNRLQKATQDARRLLEEEFAGQLLQTYDINVAAGRWNEEPGAHLQAEQRLIREKLVAWIEHRSAQINDEKEALLLALREMAFTALNRFVALKLMEARELVRPCVSGGLESEGFQEFTAVAQGLLVEQESSYRLYLETIFEDVSRELRALFDPRDPASLLWPKRTALLELLEILNRPELAELWREDETLGWIYQYFNGDSERKKMREESSAPRNSRELAVRNQFFTPRYVVEFLTDNTLGRIWYEMRQGQTGLKERCRYLVRRPDEVFLTEARSNEDRAAQSWLQSGDTERPGLWQLAHTVNGYVRARMAGEDSNRWVEERLPLIKPDKIAALTTQELLDLLFLFCRKERFCEGTLDSLQAEIDLILLTIESRVAKGGRADLSQEDLLRQPEYIPHRPLKDPREIRMLDPACGSMHFGLYAFDLYIAIYEEAWEIAQGSDEQAKQEEAFAPFVTYAADFANKAAFLREVPRLILLHNIHGIDIDPRATQIARLTLWLRAQRAWKEQQLEVTDRPAITRSNVVCAEPMPGERELLADFVDQQFPEAERGLVQQLLETIFDKMQLAGEAGSLLKIEEEIRDAIDQARREWQKLAIQQRDLFSAAELAALGQVGSSLSADLQNLTKDFWIDIEERIYTALSNYAEKTQIGNGLQRRLFAEDAAQGFAFIDVFRSKYDVVLMNPPFGELATSSKSYVFSRFSDFKADAYASFVVRGILSLSPKGRIGAITSRTGFFLSTLQKWRRVLIDEAPVRNFVDLGLGVLDAATVEACCFTAENSSTNEPSAFINCLCDDDKSKAALDSIRSLNASHVKITRFAAIPTSPFAYWAPFSLVCLFDKYKPMGDYGFRVRQGLGSSDNFRFLRSWWEVPAAETGLDTRWASYAKGGGYQPYWGDQDLCVLWKDNGREIKEKSSILYGTWSKQITNVEYYGRPGLTYASRLSDFSPRILPAGSAFDTKGSSIFDDASPDDPESLLRLLAVTQSTSFRALLSMCVPRVGQIACSYPEALVEKIPIPPLERISSRSIQAVLALARAAAVAEHEVEETHAFLMPVLKASLAEAAHAMRQRTHEFREMYQAAVSQIDDDVKEAYEIPSSVLLDSVAGAIRPHTFALDSDFEGFADTIASYMLSWILGCALGRWDIQKTQLGPTSGNLSDTFSPLPVCSPGQLQNAQGLPASPEEVPAAYPVRIPWDGILVDDPNHPLDLERSIREVIEIIWSGKEGGTTAEAIEHEACEILGVKTLRDYFRKPAGFFANHLSRYSKSRRQAPIYWQLSAGNGTYSAWLYYHRFTQDTLYRLLRDFVEPRIQQAEREQFELESQGALSGDTATRLQESQSLLQDLQLLKSELDLVAPLWNPNLNDGVIINHAILWRVTPFTPWQKKCKECWDKLVKGDYDWAHLAFHLWPERVIKKCTTDRSLAIAHGLEERLWQETNKGNWLQRQLSEVELQALIAEHSKPAVQNALERFLAAPPPVAAARTRAPRAAKSSSAGTTRRPRGSATAVDAEASRQTLLVLTAAPAEGLGRNAIADLLDVEAASLTAVIKQLKESGQIEQLGAARGARYRLTEQGRVSLEPEQDA